MIQFVTGGPLHLGILIVYWGKSLDYSCLSQTAENGDAYLLRQPINIHLSGDEIFHPNVYNRTSISSTHHFAIALLDTI